MTKKIHNCKSCKYQTTRLHDFNKHLKTIRHHKNSKLAQFDSSIPQFPSPIPQFPSPIPQFPSPIPQFPSPPTKVTFSCDHCHYVTKRKDNFNRHLLSCENKINSDTKKDLAIEKLIKEIDGLRCDETIINEQSSQISTLTETINELKTQSKMDVLSTENKLLKEHNKHVTNNSNSGVIGNNNIQNITQYIKNTYPDAPNVKTIDRIDDVEKYIGYDPCDAYANLIHDHYLKDVEPKDRSIWLVDAARDKYLTRLNGNWKIDINGEQFCKLVNNAISKALHQGKDQITDPHAQMSLVLLELVIYVANQSKMPKNKKSQFLIQNIEDWKELGKKLREQEELIEKSGEMIPDSF